MWLIWFLGLCVLCGFAALVWAHVTERDAASRQAWTGVAAILMIFPAFVIGAGDMFGVLASNIDVIWPHVVMGLGGAGALGEAIFRVIRRR